MTSFGALILRCFGSCAALRRASLASLSICLLCVLLQELVLLLIKRKVVLLLDLPRTGNLHVRRIPLFAFGVTLSLVAREALIIALVLLLLTSFV